MDIILPIIIVVAIGFIAGVGLALASKFMAVPTDEREEKIRECLPGANCGTCGYSGCDGYAAAINSGEAEPDKCTAGGETTAKALSEILGVDINTAPQTAFVACTCDRAKSDVKYAYEGMMSCAAASLVGGGPLKCEYGCIGFGDCYKACKFGAISFKDNRPIICEDLCVGCTACANACPKGIIKMIPKLKKVHIPCSNTSRGAAVAKNCTSSCLGCSLCVKSCEQNAISIVDNLAVIDYSLCTDCGKCKEACKRGVII